MSDLVFNPKATNCFGDTQRNMLLSIAEDGVTERTSRFLIDLTPDRRKRKVYRMGNYVIKVKEPKSVRKEVEVSLALEGVDGFLPVLAYSSYITVTPYVNGQMLIDLPKLNPQIVDMYSVYYGTLLHHAGVRPFDVHGENVIMSNSKLYFIDVDRFQVVSGYDQTTLEGVISLLRDGLLTDLKAETSYKG